MRDADLRQTVRMGGAVGARACPAGALRMPGSGRRDAAGEARGVCLSVLGEKGGLFQNSCLPTCRPHVHWGNNVGCGTSSPGTVSAGKRMCS